MGYWRKLLGNFFFVFLNTLPPKQTANLGHFASIPRLRGDA